MYMLYTHFILVIIIIIRIKIEFIKSYEVALKDIKY